MKKTTPIITIMFLLLLSTVSGYYTIQDSFTRADGLLNGDTATNGKIWTTTGNQYTVLNNEMNAVFTATNLPEAELEMDKTYNSSDNGFNISFTYEQGNPLLGRTQSTIRNSAGSPAIHYWAGWMSGVGGRSMGIHDGVAWRTVCTNCIIEATPVTIKFANINFTNKKFDVEVNGTLYTNSGNHYGFQNSVTNIKTFNLDTYNNPNMTYDLIATENGTGAAPPLASGKFNLTAQANGTNITTFSANVQGTLYSTTNGTLQTNYPSNNTNLANVTFYATGFTDKTYLNYNTSYNPMQGNLTQKAITTIANITHNTPILVDKNLTMSCTYNNTYGLNIVNTTYFINNTNDTIVTRTTHTNYTIPEADFIDELSIGCQICTNYTCNNGTNTNVSHGVIDSLITFRTIDTLGNLLTQTSKLFINTTGLNYTTSSGLVVLFGKQFMTYSDLIEDVAINLTSSITGFSNTDFDITINATNRTHNLTVTQNQLALYFVNDTTPFNTSGQVIHDNGTFNEFNDTTAALIQSNIPLGEVNVLFNQKSCGIFGWDCNWTQFYEYINDRTEYINETLHVLQQQDWTAYFQVQDYTGSPLENVKIRAYIAPQDQNATEAGNTSIPYKLYTQRLTNNDGITYIWTDSDVGATKFEFIKEGYETVTLIHQIGDESYTRSNPIIVNMLEQSTALEGNLWFYMTTRTTNKTRPFTGTLVLKHDIDNTLVEITTAWRQTAGLPKYKLTYGQTGWTNTDDCIKFKVGAGELYTRCTFGITNGTDFNQLNNDNITVQLWLNETTLQHTHTIEYDTNTKTDLFTFTGITYNYLNPIIAIILILAAGTAGILFNNTNAGLHTFMIGSILISFITTNFLWLSVIASTYYTLKIIRTVISE